jgi:hypothetical protein
MTDARSIDSQRGTPRKPAASRVRRAFMAGAHLDHEEHVDTAQGHSAVNMDEIRTPTSSRPGCAETAATSCGCAAAQAGSAALQYSPHRGCPYQVPEAEQLALDPLVSTQQRVRCHQPTHPSRPREQPRQGGEHHPVGPVQLGLGFCRRGTAASWRRTSSSASFEAGERASSAIQPTRRCVAGSGEQWPGPQRAAHAHRDAIRPSAGVKGNRAGGQGSRRDRNAIQARQPA